MLPCTAGAQQPIYGVAAMMQYGAVVGVRALKAYCDQHFVEFRDRNDVAFRNSVFGRFSDEAFYAALPEHPEKRQFAKDMAEVRAITQRSYEKDVTPETAKKFCENFARDIVGHEAKFRDLPTR